MPNNRRPEKRQPDPRQARAQGWLTFLHAALASGWLVLGLSNVVSADGGTRAWVQLGFGSAWLLLSGVQFAAWRIIRRQLAESSN